jgi:hypothetical protein
MKVAPHAAKQVPGKGIEKEESRQGRPKVAPYFK